VKPLTIKKINKRYILELNDPPIIQYASERPLQDKILLVDTDEKHGLKNIRNAEYCAFFDLTTRILQEGDFDIKPLSYEELNILYGSKYVKKFLRRRDLSESDINIDKIDMEKYAGNEQIIPIFNSNAQNTKNIYRLDIMFDKNLLREVGQLELNYTSVRIAEYKYRDSYKTHFIILDTLLYVLEKNYIPERLPYSDVMYDVLNAVLSTNEQDANVERKKYRRYDRYERYKFIAMACVILLIIHGYEIGAGAIPNFGVNDIEMRKIMKLLGCTWDKDKIRLTQIPKIKVRTKKNFK
ncbi:hypothetical protein THOM_2631, partial [Trachipleistophora hominis]